MTEPPRASPSLHLMLARKLSGYDVLSDAEVRVLGDTITSVRAFEAGQDLVRMEERPAFSSLLVEGWAARSRTMENGARQITSLHIPGDFVDLHGFLLHKMDHNVVALSACKAALAPHEKLKRVTEEHPHLTRLLWLSTLVDAAIHRNWIVGMGRLSAAAHMAQLLCELYVRLKAVRIANDGEFELPLSQATIADALGLSLVHVSRALRLMRSQDLIDWRQRTVKILDWNRLVAFAEFDDTYLSILHEPR